VTEEKILEAQERMQRSMTRGKLSDQMLEILGDGLDGVLETIIKTAVRKLNAGELNGTEALVLWARVGANVGLRDTLRTDSAQGLRASEAFGKSLEEAEKAAESKKLRRKYRHT
jgi:hypothetical protein